ncbi:hypothetical protein GQ44DRAFT_800384, partial [Phaeosphaeriaceae sp. PMI808]
IRENPGIVPLTTNEGTWIPSTTHGYNYRSQEGVSNTYWFCENTRIRSVAQSTLPRPLNHFKTFSIFYSAGRGFWILRGDGTTPDPGEAWHPLRFENGAADRSSYLTPAGGVETLDGFSPHQRWHHMLLPDIYHGQQIANTNQGGLRGELPIFLGLVAMSMCATNLLQWLPWMFQNSTWQVHNLPNGLNVYTCPATWGEGSTKVDLERFESGAFGKYYN